MNIVEKNLSGTAESEFSNRGSNDHAKKALELLLKWIGENPDREGLKETPKSCFYPLTDSTCLSFFTLIGLNLSLSET